MEIKTIVVSLGFTPKKLESFDLAGWSVTEQQKEALRKLNIEFEKLRAIMADIDTSKMKNAFEELARQLHLFKTEVQPQRKRWGKKRFYE